MYLQDDFCHFMGCLCTSAYCCSCLDQAKLSMYSSNLAGSSRRQISVSLDQVKLLNFQIWSITTVANSENSTTVTQPLSTSAGGATMNFTKSALELTLAASI